MIAHRHFAVRLRHSFLYVIYIVVMLLLTTALLVWVIVEGSFPRNGWFKALEVIVTLAIVLDLVVEVRLQGCSGFFLGSTSSQPRSGSFAVAASDQAACGSFCNQYGQVLWNWCHALITILCLVAMIIALERFDGSEDESEAEISLALLILRYVFYVVFLVGSQMKSLRMQGGMRNPFAGTTATNDDAWDVRFED